MMISVNNEEGIKLLNLFLVANPWYKDWDMWSAVGQWVGGIGTILAVFLAVKQMKEAKELQYDLLKPDIDIYSGFVMHTISSDLQVAHLLLDQLKLILDEGLKITICNIKQTPVRISGTHINAVTYQVIDKLRFFPQLGFKKNLKSLGRRITYGNVDYQRGSFQNSYTTTILQPGDEHTFDLDLSI